MTFRIRIKNGSRTYWHGEEFKEHDGDGNDPINWPTRELAEIPAKYSREVLGREAVIVEMAEQLAFEFSISEAAA